MKLTAYQTNDLQPRRIEVAFEGEPLATVYCDTEIAWQTTKPVSTQVILNVLNIADNFKLFFNNLGGEAETPKSEIVNPKS